MLLGGSCRRGAQCPLRQARRSVRTAVPVAGASIVEHEEEGLGLSLVKRSGRKQAVTIPSRVRTHQMRSGATTACAAVQPLTGDDEELRRQTLGNP